MSIRWRDGRPVVEVYNPTTRKKVHVKPKDYGLSFRELEGRTLERAAKTLEAKALERFGRYTGGDETCDAFYERWLDDFPRSESTDKHYRERVGRFAMDFKGRSLRSVSRTEARAWAKQNSGRVQTVKAMFFDAIEDGVASENPFAKLGAKKSKGRQGIIVLTHAEVDELSAIALQLHDGWFGQEFAAWIQWGAFTVMRPGESFDARYSLLSGDTYDLRSQFNSTLGKVTEPKHGSVGEIYVPEPAQRAVLDKPRRLGDDLMFRTRYRKQMRAGSMLYAWTPVRDTFTAKLPDSHQLRMRLARDPKDKLDPYELRHFGASYMLNDLELEPWIVAEQLRHSDGGTLVIKLYGHPDRKKAIDRIRRAHSGENVRRINPESGETQGNAAGDAR